MNIPRTIAKKRDGGEHTTAEIAELVDGYASGDVPDYQMSAWAMAVFLCGMTTAETAALTEAMLRTGAVLEKTPGSPRVDKHSTGGIGDKVSLTLAPALACCGLRVPMISGRGLGATGGTLDKLESIPGFRTDLSMDELQTVADRVGCVITGASQELVPADRKLYALRDVTATVPSIPLITASIMSKKLAEGLDSLVLDVKHGSGAFMKTHADAQALANSLVDTGKQMGVATSALLTDMNQPLGRKVGNALEVDEAVECLQGNGPPDLRELTIALGTELLSLAGIDNNQESARKQIANTLDNGKALDKLCEMVAAQGGDLNAPRSIATPAEAAATRTGIVSLVNADLLGWAVIEMRGGRKQLSDVLDHSVGLEMMVRLGDEVTVGQPLVRVYAQDKERVTAMRLVEQAIVISDQATNAPPLVAARIE